MGCTCSSNDPPPAPAAPNPAAMAAAQGAANRETAVAQARLNQTDEYTPYGSSVYTPTGGVVDGIQRYRRDISVSPTQQNVIDRKEALSQQLNTLAGDQMGRVNTALSSPVSYDAMPAAPQADSAARQSVIDAMYNQSTSRLDPRFAQDQTQLETDLANQGIGVGSTAYNSALESFGRTKNDAYTSALNQATASGGAEQSRLFGLQGNERERAIQEAATVRNTPLNEITALMGSGPGVIMPQFSQAPQTSIANTDVMGANNMAYQGQLNNYNQQMGARNASMGGLYGLAGAGLGGYANSAAGSAAIGALF